MATSNSGNANNQTGAGAADRLKDAASAAVSRVGGAVQSGRQTTAEAIGESPLAMLAGGIALGAIAGALLPRTDKEVQTLGPIGDKISRAAIDAAKAARDAGKEELGLGGSPKSPVEAILDKAVSAAGTAASKAGSAAAQSVKESSGAA